LGLLVRDFFTGWMPVLLPSQQCQSTEGIQAVKLFVELMKFELHNFIVRIFVYSVLFLHVNFTGESITEVMAESNDHNSDQTADDGNLEEDPELERLRAEEDELAHRVSAEVSVELNSHIAKLEQELRLAFDERMSALHQQCSTQAAEVISTRQVCQRSSLHVQTLT